MESALELMNLAVFFLFGCIWLVCVFYLRVKRRKGLTYLLFFTVFSIYAYKLVDFTLLQFQSLLLLKYFVPGLILNGQAGDESVNLVPLITLTLEDARTSLLNILLFLPWGFGLPFITDLRFKNIVIGGIYMSFAIELLQFMTGYLAGVTFRVADINDVLFNMLGVVVGYILFTLFVPVYRNLSRVAGVASHPVSQLINERPQIAD